jgi:hypothetical protein
MSDFENDLRSALKAGVDDDLTVGGLADGARSKLRARRRTWSGALAAAVVVAAIPVGLAVLGNDGGSGHGTLVESGVDPAATGLPDGWHWESYANIEFGVPDSWQHGSPNQWCVSGDRDQAWVSRPNEAQTLVYCESPVNGYGAVIGADGSLVGYGGGPVWQWTGGNEYPEGSWLARLNSGGMTVLVISPNEATARQIADSFRTIAEADANGCATQQDIPRIGTAPAMTPPDSGPIVLCTYSGTATGANLAGSQALSADRARALLDALATAKDDGSGVPAAECFVENPDATLILRDGEPMAWAFNILCSETGVDLGGGEVLPMSTKLMQALYGYAPEPTGSGDGGVVTDPDTSVSNDGSVVPPDSGAPDSGSGGGTSGSSGGADPGTGMEVQPAEPVK